MTTETNNGALGARTTKECQAWADTFDLDPTVIRQAVAGYLRILVEAGEPPKDSELAAGLAKLRRDVKKTIARPGTDARVDELDQMVARLSRSIDRMQILQEVDTEGSLGALVPRLQAAKALVEAVRTALTRDRR